MEQKDYRLAAIMFTDIHQFSRMMEKDEAGTIALLHEHSDLVISVVKAHGGTVIKTIGDAFLVDFRSTVDALQSALEIQDRTYQYNEEHRDLPLLLRIGLHLGDIYFYENDALGDGINIASRLQSIAHPGCICMSGDVYNLVLNKVDFQAEKLGRVSLKNISKEVHAYEIVTPNVEYDPNHDKPRAGYKPGSYAEEGEAAPAEVARAEPEAVDGSAAALPEPEGVQAIKRSILSDIKAQGRRISVTEARSKYASYGAPAEAAIEELAGKGILVKESPSLRVDLHASADPAAGGSAADQAAGRGGSYTDRFLKIGERIVNEVARSLEAGLDAHEKHASARRPDGAAAPADQGAAPAWGGHGSEWRHGLREARSEIRAQIRAEIRGKRRDGLPEEEEKAERQWGRKLKGSPFADTAELAAPDFPSYRTEVITSARKSALSFIPNALTWALFSVFFYFLNMRTSGLAVPWFIAPVVLWGIGVLQHLLAAFRKGAKAAEAARIAPMEGQALSLYRRINRSRDGFAYHASSILNTGIVMGTAYAVLSPRLAGSGFPFWALAIPVGIGFLSFLSHAAVHFPHLAGLKRKLLDFLGLERLASLFGRGGQAPASAIAEAYRPAWEEAIAVKASIADQIRKQKKKKGSLVGKEMIPALDEYLGQIRLLAERTSEVDALVEAIPMEAIRKDKAALLEKEAVCSNDRLKREYRKSIDEMARHEASFSELESQREILRLKLGSAVNSLKQMQIGVARLSTVDDMYDDSPLMAVKQKSSEIQEYLEDLRVGMEEQEKDPWAELAEAERLKTEADSLAAELGAAAGTPKALPEAADAAVPRGDGETTDSTQGSQR